ncbi:MAG TPA: DUF11 domain-containing protein [Gaiellales bacterium]
MARGRLTAGLIVLTALLGGAAQATAAVSPSQVVRPFTVRYAINTNGDIAQAANTLLTCRPGSVESVHMTTCADAQAGGQGDDNYFDMGAVDVDSDPATIDSSSATLSIPAGATVLFAGLYWGAALDAGETLPLQCIPGGARTGHAAVNPAAAGSAWLQLPGGASYVPVTASTFDTYTEQLPCGNGAADERTRYQAFANVTSLVQAGRGGTYTVGNVQAGTGADRHAGWSLVVAYQDAAQPARNLTIFDGFAQVDPNTTVPLTVSGFKTPLTGAVNTQLGIVSYEGDLTLNGDGLALDGSTLGDAAHSPTNFFDSSISHLGTPVTTSSPSYANQLGFDASVLAVPAGVVGNGDTSASIVLSTTADRYLPGVIWFRTDIYAPEMVLKKTVTDLNGGDVVPGDVLRYAISSTNTGQSSAYDTRIDDAIPAHTAYEAGSLRIVASPGGIAGVKTDAVADDQAELTGGAVRFRVGTGATFPPGADPTFPNGGGVIAPGESFEVTFDVVVAGGTPDGTQILNTAVLSSKDENGIDYTSVASAPAAVIVSGVPDMTIQKTHTGTFVRGQQGTFSLLASNVGGRATSGTVVLDDVLPAGLGIVGASGSGWACGVDPAAGSLHCERGDPLAVGAAFPPVTVLVNVLESAPDTIVNTGVTGGGGEQNLTNDSDDDTVAITSSADVAIVKTVVPLSTPAGVDVTYTLLVTNNGPSTAKGVQVSDPLPAGLAFVSVAPAACGLAGSSVTCALGDLAKGQSVSITVVAGIPAGTATGTKRNVATVASTTPDSNLANNSDDATVTITAPPLSRLQVRKTASPTSAAPGDTVVFSLTLTVPSDVDAKGVDLCDTLPAELVYVAAPGATFSKGRACWHLNVAKAHSATIFSITAKIDSDAKPGRIVNVAVAQADNAPAASGRAPVKVLADLHGVKGRLAQGVTG